MTAHRDLRVLARFLSFTLFAVVCTIGLQIKDGAFVAELATIYPDEAPHYVNGLLIADYIRDGLGQSPIAFAKAFFLSFPKVSIGHWPPMFYMLEAAWMLVVSQSKLAALIFSGLISAVLAGVIGSMVGRRTGIVSGILVVLFYVLTPLVRNSAAAVMVDLFIALVEFAATLALARYVMSPSWRWSAGFGLIASVAILSKGNGLALALLPPLALLLTNRFDLVLRADFWVPVPIVALLCGPWYVATYNLASDGWVYQPGASYMMQSLLANSNACILLFGIAGCLLAAYGFACSFVGRYDVAENTLVRSLVALILAIFLFQILVPSGLDPRYVLGFFPPFAILAVLGIRELSADIASLFGSNHSRRARGLIVVILALAVIVPKLASFATVAQKPTLGMKEAANIVTDDHSNPNRTVLITSDAIGEGAFVVEMAQHLDKRARYVIARGSKLLASANFLMEDYVARFSDASGVAKEVGKLGIRFVVIDTSKNGFRFKHSQDLLAAARQDGWALVGQFPHARYDGETLVYELKPARVPTAVEQAAIGCVWAGPSTAISNAGSVQLKKPMDTCS